jgi:hypothetical protein
MRRQNLIQSPDTIVSMPVSRRHSYPIETKRRKAMHWRDPVDERDRRKRLKKEAERITRKKCNIARTTNKANVMKGSSLGG